MCSVRGWDCLLIGISTWKFCSYLILAIFCVKLESFKTFYWAFQARFFYVAPFSVRGSRRYLLLHVFLLDDWLLEAFLNLLIFFALQVLSMWLSRCALNAVLFCLRKQSGLRCFCWNCHSMFCSDFDNELPFMINKIIYLKNIFF